MANLAITNTFTNNTTADASQVNTNFSDISTWLNNRDNATDVWLNLSVTGTVANPVIFKSNAATTEVAIDNTATDGDPELTFKLSGSQKFVIGVDDSDSDFLKFATGGITSDVACQIPTVGAQVQFNAGTISLPSISFIGDTNTGLYSAAGDQVGIVVNGASAAQFLTTEIDLYVGGGAKVILMSTSFNPAGAGAISTGDGVTYWNDVSYKTLTDRGCLPWCDDGVEMSDGKRLSDLAALSMIQKHPTKKTPSGLPRLDYSTFPKHAYRRAEDEFPDSNVERDSDGNAWIMRQNRETKQMERIQAQDGVEMTMMFGLFIGAFKEIEKRLVGLEAA